MKPTFVIHDVLQHDLLTLNQLEAVKVKPFFEWFKECMSLLKGQKVILAVIAEGIDKQPEWVDYIKAHKEWEIQLHGWDHRTLTRTPVDDLEAKLFHAKLVIEEAFNRPVTKFYPPKLKYNDITAQAARRCGLEEIRNRSTVKDYLEKWEDINEVYAHFWNRNDIERIRQICRLPEKI